MICLDNHDSGSLRIHDNFRLGRPLLANQLDLRQGTGIKRPTRWIATEKRFPYRLAVTFRREGRGVV